MDYDYDYEEEDPNQIQIQQANWGNNGNGDHDQEEGQEGGGVGRGKKSHSIKVPRLYKEAAKALKQVEDGAGLKNAIHSLKHPNVKAITALVSESLKHSDLLEKLLSKSKILENEKGLSYQVPLTKVLVTELLWGKKRLGGDSKPVQTVLAYQEKFEKVINKIERKNKMKNTIGDEDGEGIQIKVEEQDEASVGPESSSTLKKPRYARVNTIKTDLSTVISYLIDEGWEQMEREDYLSLEGYSFAVDNFVENLLVFPSGTELYKHPLYKDGSLVLQDKASCLPPLALKPRVGRTVLDACAAPGMKTSLLAALMKNEGSLIAVERDPKRCNVLRTLLDGYGVTNATVVNRDFTEISPDEYPDVEYILVDPSCSGSGMYNRIELQHGPGATRHKERLRSLSYCQRKLLVHAMKFPNVKRIVYSTCSINSTENEHVVASALEWGGGYESADTDTFRLNFRVKQTLPNWANRLNNSKYEWSEFCVKADYENDLTDGFFVAVLEKIKSK